ncbi:hypothetical protein CVIRNUC_010921 [Coccomyxa viridis]|uniref:pyruvate decarboxylase n=1 Tax=Coccomyxa viridis TaxID=1274662 RepID=A0AAV1IP02_9CHLO|nr:hypothetical protein CVIRNUC_010921 [Coccomyxa viridis]
MTGDGGATLGQFIAARLVEVGCTDYFGVPGDYNMNLMDQLNAEPDLNMVPCCNELNAGYAADGYARAKGVGCVVVTFTVGGLSAINAVAGAMSEHLPVICITGIPNSNDFSGDKILHHTIGNIDFSQELRCFEQVTCKAVTIRNLSTANELVDTAIAAAMQEKKPVLIQVCCNLATMTHPLFDKQPVPYALSPKTSNPKSLAAAVDAAVSMLSKSPKPVILVGPQAKPFKSIEATCNLADKTKYATAVIPNAKGDFPETHETFIGTYWGLVSTPCTAEIVESASTYIIVGPLFNDYNTVAFTLLLDESKIIKVDPHRATIGGKSTYGCVNMSDFLEKLVEALEPNPTSLRNFKRMYSEPTLKKADPKAPLETAVLYDRAQGFLKGEHVVMADTGDCIFWTQKLRLPYGAGFQAQMQYGSIGWSVGACLGCAVGSRSRGRRIVLFVGDGCFQIGAQELSTMIRVGTNPVIFLLDNAEYVIEEQIHPGSYNKLQDWDYCALAHAMKGKSDNLYAVKVTTEEELVAALKEADGKQKDKVCLLQCKLDPEDCSPALREWGARLANYNARPPKIV